MCVYIGSVGLQLDGNVTCNTYAGSKSLMNLVNIPMIQLLDGAESYMY